MIAKTENKLKRVHALYINGQKKDAAKIVRGLTKLELFYFVSTHNILAIPAFISNKEGSLCFENFICNALEGVYL